MHRTTTTHFVLSLFLVCALFIVAATPARADTVCATTVADVDATCTGTITSDTASGSCRSITCETGENSVQVLACDKPDIGAKEYFEMYRQSVTGTAPTLCLGDACISTNGFASQTLPYCTGTPSEPIFAITYGGAFATSFVAPHHDGLNDGTEMQFHLVNVDGPIADIRITDSTSGVWEGIYNGSQYVTNGAGNWLALPVGDDVYVEKYCPNSGENTFTATITYENGSVVSAFATAVVSCDPVIPSTLENATLSVAPWFPQGLSVVWVCAPNTEGDYTYDFTFGDGEKILGYDQGNVYHTYAANGTYDVTCTVHDVDTSVTASNTITLGIAGPVVPMPTVIVFDNATTGNGLSDTEHAMRGDGSWSTNGVNKFEHYILPEQLFGSKVKISDIASITYHTYKDTPQDGNNFYLQVYTDTAGCVDQSASWYCSRLTLEPMYSYGFDDATGVWNAWNTDTGVNQLTIYDQPRSGLFGWYYPPTLEQLQAGSINWQDFYAGANNVTRDYRDEEILYLSLQTGSTVSAGFNASIDEFTVTLNNGTSVIVDFEPSPAVAPEPTPTNASVTLSVAPWYPQGDNFVLECAAQEFTPTLYSWYFGDGQKLVDVTNSNVYHTYSPGSYTATCVATNGSVLVMDTLDIVAE